MGDEIPVTPPNFRIGKFQHFKIKLGQIIEGNIIFICDNINSNVPTNNLVGNDSFFSIIFFFFCKASHIIRWIADDGWCNVITYSTHIHHLFSGEKKTDRDLLENGWVRVWWWKIDWAGKEACQKQKVTHFYDMMKWCGILCCWYCWMVLLLSYCLLISLQNYDMKSYLQDVLVVDDIFKLTMSTFRWTAVHNRTESVPR